MLGRVVSCAGKLLAQQLTASAATSSAVQQAAAAAGCSGLLQKLGQQWSGYATNSHDIFNIHKHAPDNNWNTEFDFTPENYKRVRHIHLTCPHFQVWTCKSSNQHTCNGWM
jgi:NADH dehydrogenase (ubiquinone) flavoprotein 2